MDPAPMPNPTLMNARNHPALLSLPLIAIALLSAAIAGCDRRGNAAGPPPGMPPPPMVMVTEAVARDVPIYLDEIGKFSASEYVAIKPQVSGRIQTIGF